MSDLTPPTGPDDASGVEDTAIIPPQEAPAATPRGKRTAIIAAASLGTVAVLGAGAFAYVKLSGGGPQPADVLPASALAIVSVDLDPSASQKIEAIKTIRKFPGLKDELDLNSGDDLRETFFKQTFSKECKNLSYDDDILPWVGERVALAAVDLGAKKVAPVFALQVKDQGKADAGIKALIKCDDPGDDFGYAFNDDYLLISDSTAHAETIVADAKTASLAKDANYKLWSEAAGGSGIINFYVARKAVDFFADEIEGLGESLGDELPVPGGGDGQDLPEGFPTDLPSDFPTSLPSDFPTSLPTELLPDLPQASSGAYVPGGGNSAPAADPTDPIKDALKKFEGLAGSVRFANGGVELEVVAGGLKQATGTSPVGKSVSALPKDTAAALGFSVPKDFAEKVLKQLGDQFGSDFDKEIADAETTFGLDLPEDAQTLLGKGITLSLGGDAPADLNDTEGPQDLPIGATITGDADKIKAIIAKMEERSGESLSDQGVELDSEGDRVALATQSSYLKALLKDGGLGNADGFKTVVPEADRATGIFYVDFNSKWRDTIIETFGGDEGDEFVENLKPLEAVGISAWLDGDKSHVLVKLTTD